MEYIIIGFAVIGFAIWTIRPLYNFFAKNKYILLAQNEDNLMHRLKAGLPAILFYSVIFAFIMVPATANDLVKSTTTATIVFLEIVLIFTLTRYDKIQTKYHVNTKGVIYHKKNIAWDDTYTINFKKTSLFVLHKPRFIIKTKKISITIPLLSKNINNFIEELTKHDEVNGSLCSEIIKNARLYYIKNPEIQKKLNKMI